MLYVAGECKEQLLVLAKELEKACAEGDRDKIEEAHKALEDKLESLGIMMKIADFDKECQHPDVSSFPTVHDDGTRNDDVCSCCSNCRLAASSTGP